MLQLRGQPSYSGGGLVWSFIHNRALPMPRKLSVYEICQLITAMLHSGYPTVDKTAGILEISKRTLQRQLSQSGVTYAELVTRCRLKEAQSLLKYSEQDVQEIAAMLGYADPSSFSRAFMRWSGTTPRRYRCEQVRLHSE